MLNPLLYFIVKNYRFINDNQSARDNDNMIKSYYNTNTSFLNGYNITSKSMNATFENLLTTLNVQYYQNDNTSLYLCGLVMGTCSMLGSKSIDAVIEQCESMYSKEINQYKKLFVAHCNKNKINYIDIHNQSYNPKHDCKKLFDKINQDIRGNYNYEDFMTNLLHCMNPTYLLKDSYSIEVLISNKFYSHDPFDIHHKIQSYAEIFTFNNRYIKPPVTTINDTNISSIPIEDVDMNTGIFSVGVSTIEKLNKISLEIKTDNIDDMVSTVNTLKLSLNRFKKYTEIGWFGKLFTSDIEIKANISISMFEFENMIKKGAILRSNMESQYNTFGELHTNLKNLFEGFNEDIIQIDSYIADPQYSNSDRQRLQNRKNDILSAQMLCTTTSMQYNLAQNNIGILIDKFNAIESILKPAMEMNAKILSSELKKLL